jgi:hypothetical protein
LQKKKKKKKKKKKEEEERKKERKKKKKKKRHTHKQTDKQISHKIRYVSYQPSLGVTPPKPKFKFHELSNRNPQKTIKKHKKRNQEIEITQKDDCESRRARKKKGTS